MTDYRIGIFTVFFAASVLVTIANINSIRKPIVLGGNITMTHPFYKNCEGTADRFDPVTNKYQVTLNCATQENGTEVHEYFTLQGLSRSDIKVKE
jgi:hypothetical protein